ncbi:hypothetical protein LOC68_06005 [Blastopirellula sp. JC732]|uniref:Uncharacterized protein n=1 Tax=Blastopirellula sediminis TaxID=2894196 RepID=A0A9X1SFN4_9BACT|nr:hypothetical protein [Blastopirellula sediminis]MCC9609281.1 hypothetical protein [Blastopirellula sediminis]MCC9627942.1 hypothetical protein [Blastopirellula sediminis]
MSSDSDIQFVDAIDADGRGLFVSFPRRGDRFGHVVSIVSGDEIVPCMVSLEGDDEEEWPDSPPIQQLSIEERENGAVALGVGQAGKSHWSVTVETFAAERRVEFHVACRLKMHPAQISSRYASLLGEGVSPKSVDPYTWSWTAGDKTMLVREFVFDHYPAPEFPAGDAGFEINAAVDQMPFPKTIEWRYSFQLA